MLPRVFGVVDGLHIYRQRLLDLAACPFDHTAISLQCCRSVVGVMNVLHIYDQLLLDLAVVTLAMSPSAFSAPAALLHFICSR